MNSKKLFKGILLLITFVATLILIFLPIYGDGQNGLEYTDNFFNSLAKGSSNYMPQMRKLAQEYVGTPVAVELAVGSDYQAQKTALLYTAAGAQVEVSGPVLKINGDLGNILLQSVNDAEAMFNNQGEQLRDRYQYHPKEALKHWWGSLKNMKGALTKQKKFKQAKVVTQIMSRALEPAYNFYGIAPASVSANVGLLTFMLVFYVVYTLWYGYGIFEMFEGLGLSMEKSAVKEEV
ncbi:MAG: hypothetical protein BZ151_10345 [Desulfobacca sp. 4484_104]|nr:MAG: hypothetical protein BZ151_10345 [Desulfobacca sp. 4484_104]